jgi:putative ABC transport system permease protein
LIETFYMAWRYLAFHKLKTFILVTSVALIVYLPIGLRVLVDQSSRQLTARAQATPLIIGAKGSQLELVLNTLYFRSDYPEIQRYQESIRVSDSRLAIPLYVRFHSQGHPIVGTTLEYFDFRALKVRTGRLPAVIGECVLGARVAAALQAQVGDHVISSPENLFDLAGVYPLKMRISGILEFSDSPDDDAIFVDLKTTWIIEGLGHGHQDLTAPEAASGILAREEDRIVANASVVQYTEITQDNRDSFHFHGDLLDYPITAVIAVPHDQKSAAILQGRYLSPEGGAQIVRPTRVMEELLDTVLTVQNFVVAGAIVVGLATLATVTLVFLLSLRLRRREMETLFKIGGGRLRVAAVMASEMAAVLVLGTGLAGGLTLLTSQLGSLVIRTLVRM